MKQNNVILKQLFSLALPIIFSNLISASSSLINMFFIASINPEALAAGALITSTYGLITLMVVSILYSVSILIGQNYGMGRHEETGAIISSGIVIATVFGIFLTGLMFYMAPILELLHQPAEVSFLAGEYFHGIAYGLIPSLIGAVFTQFFMGISKARLMLYFTTIGVGFNILISYLLIFGTPLTSPLGVFGAGLATSMTAWFLLLIILTYVFTNQAFQKYGILPGKIFKTGYCKPLLKIGVPISLQYTLELLAFSVLTYSMGVIGTDALGAQQIALQCSMVAIMIVMGFSQSGSILISQSMGHGTISDRKLIANYTFTVAGILMLGIGIIYWVFPDTLIAFYLDINDPALSEMISLSQTILAIAAFTQLFDAGRNIAAGLLRGYGDTKSSMWTSLISCWIVGLPLAFLLAFFFHLGAPGLRLGIMFGILFGCIHLMHHLSKVNKTATHSTFYANRSEAI